MNKLRNIDAARDAADRLAGTLDLLATLHATAASADRDSETKARAATFALLHDQARQLASLLD